MSRIRYLLVACVIGMGALPVYGFDSSYRFSVEVKSSEVSGRSPWEWDGSVVDWIGTAGTRRFAAGFSVGNTHHFFKGTVNFKLLWDRDSVVPGDTFMLRIVVETDSTIEGNPAWGGLHEIYSNYGLTWNAGQDFRSMWNPFTGWGDWQAGPGIGIDFNVNIKADGPLPMIGEELYGDDEIDFLDLMPDLDSKSSRLKDRYGKPLRISASQGDIIGLFDIGKVKLSGGLKLANGSVTAWIRGDENVFHVTQSATWQHRGDTVLVPVYVEPMADEGDIGYISIYNVVYGAEMYERMGMKLTVFGVTVLSSNWSSSTWSYQHVVPLEPDPPNNYVTSLTVGAPSAFRSDLSIDINDLRIWHTAHRLNETVFTDVPEVGGYTMMTVRVRNVGNAQSAGFDAVVQYPDTTRSYHYTDPIPPGGNAEIGLPQCGQWQEWGEFPVKITIVPDSACRDTNAHNDTLTVFFRVTPRNITIPVALVDGNDTLTPSISNYTVSFSTEDGLFQAPMDTTPNNLDRWVIIAPAHGGLNVSAIPDSTDTLHFPSSIYINMDTVSSNSFWLYLPALRHGYVTGVVTDELGALLDSCGVRIGPFLTTTDSSGHFFQKVPPTETDTSYMVQAIREGYFPSDSIPITVTSGDTVNVSISLMNRDTTPPQGSFTINNYASMTGDRNVTLYMTAFDDSVPPRWVMVTDNGLADAWQTFDYDTNSVYFSMHWTLHPVTSHNEIDTVKVKFVDQAHNESEVYTQSIILVQDGPDGTFQINHGNTSTNSTNISITDVVALDTLADVRGLTISGGVEDVTYPYRYGATYPYTIGDLNGWHTISVVFKNSLGVEGPAVTSMIQLDRTGGVTIDSGAVYTRSSTVSLQLDGLGIACSMIETTNTYYAIGSAIGQSFIPGVYRINSVDIDFASSMGEITVSICTDSLNANGNHVPGHTLASVVLESPSGWSTADFGSVFLNPNQHYLIVISGGDYVGVKAADDSRYPDGHLYDFDDRKSQTGYDMAFIVVSAPEDMWIDNSPYFQGGSGWIPFSSTYDGWQLSSGEGNRTVYVRFRTGSSVSSTYQDMIIVDTSAPSPCSLEVNGGRSFTSTRACELSLNAVDTLSGVVAYRVGDGEWEDYTTYAEIELDDGPTGYRTICVNFKDNAGNVSDDICDTVYFDSIGPTGELILNGGNYFASSETVSVTIQLDPGVNADEMWLSRDMVNWSDPMPFSGHATYVFDHVGPVGMFVRLRDTFGLTNTISANCYIDTSPPPPAVIYDEGDITINHNQLRFYWQANGDYESGTDSFVVHVLTGVGGTETRARVSGRERAAVVEGNFHGGSVYYAWVEAFNGAGLSSNSDMTDGIMIANGITPGALISPSDSEVFVSPDSIVFVWHRAADSIGTISGYRLYIDDQLVGSTTDTSLVLHQIPSDGAHNYFVVAFDDLGDSKSSYSRYFFVTTEPVPGPPAPISPMGQYLNSTQVDFLWHPSSKFTVSRESASGKPVSSYELKLLRIGADTTVYEIDTVADTSLTIQMSQGRFIWMVRGRNSVGIAGEWSDECNFVVDTSPPSAPQLVSPLNDTLPRDSTRFIWRRSADSLSGIQAYRLILNGDTADWSGDTSLTMMVVSGELSWYVEVMDSAGDAGSSDTGHFVVVGELQPLARLNPPDSSYQPDNSIYFQWEAMQGYPNPHYVLQFGTDSTFASCRSDTTQATAAGYDLPESTIYWRVRGLSGIWRTEWSDIGVFHVDTTPPAFFWLRSPISWDTVFTESVLVVWEHAEDNYGVANYTVYFYPESQNWLTDSVSSQDTSVTILLSDGRWSVYVAAQDMAGHRSYSQVVQFYVENRPLPIPQPVSPQAGQWVAALPVQFTWNTGKSVGLVDDAPKVREYIIEVSGESGTFVDTVETNSATMDIGEGRFYWRVRSFESGRTSDWSDSVGFSVDTTRPQPPELVSPSDGTVTSDNDITFIWHHGDDNFVVSSYFLAVAADSEMNTADYIPCSDTIFSYESMPDSTWYWTVISRDSAGWLSYHGEIRMLIVDTQPPQTPVLQYPVDGEWVGTSDITLVWSDSKRIEIPASSGSGAKGGFLESSDVHYIVEIGLANDSVFTDTTDETGYSFQFDEGRYTWRVMAYDDAGNASEWTEMAFFGVDITPPGIESVSVIGDTSWFFGPFEIQSTIWDTLSGVFSAWLFWAFDGTAFDSAAMGSSGESWHGSIPEFGDSANHTVSYFVKAVNGAEPEGIAFSDTLSFSVTSVTETFDGAERGDIRLSITNDFLSIHVPDSQDISIAIYDITGRKIRAMTCEAGNHRLDLSSLKSGVYLLRLKVGGSVRTSKFVRVKR